MAIWHWLIPALIILCTWVLPVYLGIRTGRRMPALARLDYVKILAGLILIVVALRFLQMHISNPVSTMLISLAYPLVNYAASQRLVRRLADAGYGPLAAWLCIIPVANIIVYLTGCFLPQKPQQIIS